MFRVVATNKFGPSKPSNPCTGQTIGVPRQPDSPNATESTPTTITISWKDRDTPIADDPITYTVEISEDGKSFKAAKYKISTNSTKGYDALIEGLDAGKSYYFQTIASNKQGPSSPSKPVNVKTLDGLPVTPGTPTVDNETATSVQLHWADHAPRDK